MILSHESLKHTIVLRTGIVHCYCHHIVRSFSISLEAWHGQTHAWTRHSSMYSAETDTFMAFFTINLLCFLGNVQVNWPKLFQVFSVTFTYACVHSIIPHQHV